MKMQITVNIKNDNNSEVAEQTTIEIDIPEFEAFTGPDKFGEIFDQYEREVLKVRNDVVEAATEKYLSELAKLDLKVVSHMIEELNRGQEKEKHIELSELHETFEDPNAVKANISIDDVCCKKQKVSGRKKGSPPKEKREMVYNAVAHIQEKASKTYTLTTSTIPQMMIIVLAFLLSNGLMSLPGSLVFFTDVARDLRSAIQDIFSFIPIKTILDWYHLKKKCKDLLSMAINGKQVKNVDLCADVVVAWQGGQSRAGFKRSQSRQDQKSPATRQFDQLP